MSENIERIRLVKTISPEAAHAAVGAALRVGADEGCAVVAAVVDAAGELVAFVRATGAPFHSSDIARDKAYTAASFKMPTADIPGIVSGSDALRDGITRRRNMVMFGGGLPIVVDGEIVGGIGVSGGSEAMDTAYANAGLAVIGAKIFD
jgi:uncharacterized protein GlcG (DUF336 family)